MIKFHDAPLSHLLLDGEVENSSNGSLNVIVILGWVSLVDFGITDEHARDIIVIVVSYYTWVFLFRDSFDFNLPISSF